MRSVTKNAARARAADGPDPPPESSPEEMFERFRAFARKVIAVPKSVIDEREREYKKRRKAEREEQGRAPKKT